MENLCTLYNLNESEFIHFFTDPMSNLLFKTSVKTPNKTKKGLNLIT